ncbi:MAG: primosomal protein N' [Steroidobacteraceae bacterium]
MNARIYKVAIDTPLRRLFDYLPAAQGPQPQPGMRVLVPFGRRRSAGLVVDTADESDLPESKLRNVLQVLDAAPLFDASMLGFLRWAADYYHHPIGQVIAAAMPKLLREGRDLTVYERRWRITPAGRTALAAGTLQRAPRQRALLDILAPLPWLGEARIEELAPHWRGAARSLAARGFIAVEEVAAATPPSPPAAPQAGGLVLTADQQRAVEAVHARLGTPAAFLLDGVTGSGKTEVYLQLAAATLARGESVLVLCPEIGLTPQLVGRFGLRFPGPVAALHSGLTDRERAAAWQLAASGGARIVIGTRSAVFAPIPRLGLVVVDEEHDASYKQQEGGFRYSARDLALLRAQRAGIPVLLGSATPSFESLHNVQLGKLQPLSLPARAGNAAAPRAVVVDMRAHAVHKGFAMPLIAAMERHLAAGSQVLLYLNRRGYAPTLLCTACGWVAGCRQCDARLTVHQRSGRLACHHCGAEEARPASCPRCGYPVQPLGHGTERVEETLAERFAQYAVERFDRDTLQHQQALEGAIGRVTSGAARILVGTQMLTKGHHFPEVTLVGVLNADQSLFSTDFRAAERLAQTIVQVAGRAGRADRPGEVLIQSQYPDHPLLRTLVADGYGAFARDALAERAAAHWPPYGRIAMLRASGTAPDTALGFLRAAVAAANRPAGIALREPIPAAMTRRAGRYHAQLLVECSNRGRLQQFLATWVPSVEALPAPANLRWALDVDPLEVF